MVGMTAEELNLALGKPDKTNAAQYGVDSRNQLIYYRNGRTLYVYADNGVVSAIQDTEGPATPSRQTRCPSAKEIREIELEKSKIANRDDARLQSELTTRLLDAKACR